MMSDINFYFTNIRFSDNVQLLISNIDMNRYQPINAAVELNYHHYHDVLHNAVSYRQATTLAASHQ